MTSSLPVAPAFPFARECPYHPPELYKRARAEQPVFPVTLWNGQRAWLITKYEDVKAVITDPRFSGRFSRPDFPAVTEARVAIDKAERAFVGMDNPEHGRYRRMFTPEFSSKHMLELRPRIEAIARDLVDGVIAKGPPTDLVEALAVPFPALVMCALFGTAYEDHQFIMECAAARHGMTLSASTATGKARALVDYMRRLIDHKEANPVDDMVSRIIRDHVLPGKLSREDFAEIGAMILRGGFDTTVNMIGTGTLLLLQNRALFEQLRADPALMPGAVEELLRFVSPVQYAPRRVALEDVEFGGALIRKGDGIFPLLQAANRDERVFANPDELDFGRADANQQLAFGFGIHQCLGQMLARMELQIMFGLIVERLPGLRLAVPVEEIRFKSDMQIYGIYNLPVSW